MREFFKRLLALLLCMLFLPVCNALGEGAYTVQQIKSQAAAGWHCTYEAYGRRIEVNIDVNVPDVSALPVLAMDFASYPIPTGLGNLLADGRPEDNVLWLETPTYPEPVSGKTDKLPDGVFDSPDEMERAYAPGNALTLQQALALVKQALESLGTADFQLDAPYLLRTFCYEDAKTHEIALPGEYSLYFHQLAAGVPILCHAGVAFAKRDSAYYEPFLVADVVSEDALTIFMGALTTQQLIAQDVPLCSLEKVLKAIETEIDNGYIRKVFRLELGYVLFDDPAYRTPNRYARHYIALPMWQVQCLYVKNAAKELPSEEQDVFLVDTNEAATLLVNAQTGEMLDILLMLFTFGIWLFIWIYRVTDYLNCVEGEERRDLTKKLLLCMFVPFYSIYWMYKSAQRVDKLAGKAGVQSDISTLCLILAISVAIVPPILIQDKLNNIVLSGAVVTQTAAASQQVQSAANAESSIEKLEKLAKLKEQGILTEAEFKQKKAELLEKM